MCALIFFMGTHEYSFYTFCILIKFILAIFLIKVESYEEENRKKKIVFRINKKVTVFKK